ncbi:MAG: hypothetical protein IKA06_06745 [Clostridia bacterium]|nr:hypothetical protein [Clostridia bacterium]
MDRYIIKNNAPVAPPRCGVTASGRVVSNFARRIKNDADFAAENGYYPLAKQDDASPELLEEHEAPAEGKYTLIDGEWVYVT